MLFLICCKERERAAHREGGENKNADLRLLVDYGRLRPGDDAAGAAPWGLRSQGRNNAARRWCGGASASPLNDLVCLPGAPLPAESVASPRQNGQSLFARQLLPPPDLLSIRIHRLTPTTPLLHPSQPQARHKEGHQRKQAAQALDRLQPTRRRRHQRRDVPCTRARTLHSALFTHSSRRPAAHVAFGGVALLGRAAYAAAYGADLGGARGGSGCGSSSAAVQLSSGGGGDSSSVACERSSVARASRRPPLATIGRLRLCGSLL